MDLKIASNKAFEIAKKRGQYKGDGLDTVRALKHCAGEVIEACEAYTKFVFCQSEIADTFPEEIADVAMCVLSICGAENIDLEQELLKVFEKNIARIK